MLYSLKIDQKKNPTDTYIFETKLLLALDVEILEKELDAEIFKPFTSINEIIKGKNAMRKAPKGNIPILLSKFSNKIEVSSKLYKSSRIKLGTGIATH